MLYKKWLKFCEIVLEKEFLFDKKVLHVKILDRKEIIYFIMKGLCILRGGKWKVLMKVGERKRKYLVRGHRESFLLGKDKLVFILQRGGSRLLFVERDSEEFPFCKFGKKGWL
jgi:hypothetical protein